MDLQRDIWELEVMNAPSGIRRDDLSELFGVYQFG